jgi:hypothetical protein
MNNFYVYRHIRLDSNTPFYVGKGKRSRATDLRNRNIYWRRIVSKVGYKVEVFLSGLTEKQAFAKEIELIKLYKDLGYCEANLSNGGEGNSGFRRSEETKKLDSIKSKGRKHREETKLLISLNNPWKGKVLPKEEIEKRIKNRKWNNSMLKGSGNGNFKGFWITPIGKFDSMTEAVKANGIPKSSLQRYCKTNKPGFSFENKNSR